MKPTNTYSQPNPCSTGITGIAMVFYISSKLASTTGSARPCTAAAGPAGGTAKLASPGESRGTHFTLSVVPGATLYDHPGGADTAEFALPVTALAPLLLPPDPPAPAAVAVPRSPSPELLPSPVGHTGGGQTGRREGREHRNSGCWIKTGSPQLH